MNEPGGVDPYYDQYNPIQSRFESARAFIQGFTDSISMSSTTIRQSVVVFSGPNLDDPDYENTPVIGDFVLFNNTASESNTAFQDFLTNDMSLLMGGANTPEALNFVRTQVLTSQTQRPGVFRFVVLITDGAPSNGSEEPDDGLVFDTIEAIQSIQTENNAFVVFLKTVNTEGSYPSEWNETVFDYTYLVEDFVYLSSLTDTFLCNLTETHRPTTSPTMSMPTSNPTTSVPTASPVLCTPGNVTCCVSTAILGKLCCLELTGKTVAKTHSAQC